MLAMLDDPKLQRWYPAVLFAVSVAALGLALHAQFFLGLEPCNLCLYQRIPYAVIGLFAGAGMVRPDAKARRAVVWLAAAAFAIGAAIAVYHVGVEQHWWASAVCGGKVADVGSAKDLMAGLSAPPEKSCDSVDWVFLGLSMATYNAVFSAVMAGLCAVAFRRMKAA
jgi:disulfide bond formation protein DsbB